MLRFTSRAVSIQTRPFRNFHTSTLSRLREITVENKDDKTTIIDCKYVKSPREPYLLKLNEDKDKCPLCKLKLNLKYTDVLILCQYIDSNGNIFKRKHTNLCANQYKLVKELIYMAQYAGLLPEPPKDEPKKPYNLLNTYYDETTINLRPKYFKRNMRLYALSDKLSPQEKYRMRLQWGSYSGPKV